MALSQMLVQHVLAASIALLGLAAAGGKHPAADPAHARVGFDGLGPVKIGMAVEEAERALGIRLASGGEPGLTECHYVQNEAGLPGAALLVVGGRIVRADVYGPGHVTDAGVRIGSTEDEVERAYPQVAVEPHPYLDEGHSLRVDSGGGARSIVFETDGEAVISFRAGEREAIGSSEGCE